jgi:hypothetical protein
MTALSGKILSSIALVLGKPNSRAFRLEPILEVTRRLRYENPRLCMEILVDVLDETLKGREAKSFSQA